MHKNKQNDTVRNLKGFLTSYVASDHGKRVINRPTGYMSTGKTRKVDFYALKGERVVITNKDVRDTRWQNPALAQALMEAARG